MLFGLVLLEAGDSATDYLLRGETTENIASLDGRTAVWEASAAAIAERPVLGYGYVIGARQAIRDHWTARHWVPPHAHNEFVQAMLVGGVPCCILVLYLYLSVIGTSLKRSRWGPLYTYIWLVVIQLSAFALIGINLSVQYSSLGAAFILCFLGLRERPLHATDSQANHAYELLDTDRRTEAMSFRLSG